MAYLNYLVPALLAIAIIIAIIFKDSIRVVFKGMRLKADNLKRKNSTYVKGDENIVHQGNAGSKTAADNKATIRGNKSNIRQE